MEENKKFNLKTNEALGIMHLIIKIQSGLAKKDAKTLKGISDNELHVTKELERIEQLLKAGGIC